MTPSSSSLRSWPVPVEPQLQRHGEGWLESYTADHSELWAGPHLNIYPGIWFAARSLAALTRLKGGIPSAWSIHKGWFRDPVHPGDPLVMLLQRRGEGYRVEHRSEGPHGAVRAAFDVMDKALPHPGPGFSFPPPQAGAATADPPSEYELREVTVVSARVALPAVEGVFQEPMPGSWLLANFPPAPHLWLVEALGQLSFIGFNHGAGRRQGGILPPARYVAGRLGEVWISNREAGFGGSPGGQYWGRAHRILGGESAGVARAVAGDLLGPLGAMECLYARVGT